MKYLDRKFWHMFLGFVLIILVSMGIIVSTRTYQEKQLEKDIEVNLANPTQ